MELFVLYLTVVLTVTSAATVNKTSPATQGINTAFHHEFLNNPIGSHFPDITGFGAPQKATTLSCPNPNNPAGVFELDTSPALEAGYPVQLIAAELVNRQNLASVLAQEIPAQSGLDLTLPADLPFEAAEPKCAISARNVWTFKSQQNRGICWVLQGFQDPVFAINCVSPVCKGCDSTQSNLNTGVSSVFNNDFWKSFHLPGFPFSHSPLPAYKNICTPRFRVRTIWAYCPVAPGALKVVREQLIVPSGCSCRRVKCQYK
ncbi:hypothetical protein SNE40_016287 [Patella caerulea]|uniref:Uncharacterized protein n=1 Tax=Patella caerulea TaxID=87958 RepID=A0AAN8PIN1_PATCE